MGLCKVELSQLNHIDYKLLQLNKDPWYRLWHMKNKGMQQSHAFSQSSEAIDVKSCMAPTKLACGNM